MEAINLEYIAYFRCDNVLRDMIKSVMTGRLLLHNKAFAQNQMKTFDWSPRSKAREWRIVECGKIRYPSKHSHFSS